mmetsp:Transcript_27378/g.52131  ORF Transcript_27378/g.52131 Transcript_27378/m.52131 type:complete len:501 (+) Transcript_27378:30-1532(+)
MAASTQKRRRRRRRTTTKDRSRPGTPRAQPVLRCSASLSKLLTDQVSDRLDISRSEAVKQVWAYAARHNLKESGTIKCDARLRDVFGVPILDFSSLSRALSPHLQALASAPAAPADVHGFDEMVWASEQVSRLMLAPGGAGLRSHDWVCDQGLVSLTQKQALRWLGNFIKLHGLRSPDKMYVYRQTDLWGILDAHPRAEKMHLQEVSARFQQHLRKRGPPASAPRASNSGRRENNSQHPNTERNEVVDEDESTQGSESAQSHSSDDEQGGPRKTGGGSELEDSDDEDDAPLTQRLGSQSTTATWRPRAAAASRLHSPLPPASASVLGSSPGAPHRTSPRRMVMEMGFSSRDVDEAIAELGGGAAVMCDQIVERLLQRNSAQEEATLPGTTTSAGDRACPQQLVGEESRMRACSSSNNGHSKTSAVPNEYLCPITMAVMIDPVIAMDGFSYEREAIELWLKESKRSPVTNMSMKSKTVIPNQNLKILIREYAHGLDTSLNN